jgi:hypothetical protein
MGLLMITSETGIPHSACLLQWDDGRSEWLGFEPSEWYGGKGFVDTTDRSDQIDEFVQYQVDDGQLQRGRTNVIAKYYAEIYQIGVNDCVSFARDIARACGVLPYWVPAFTPSSFVKTLATINERHVDYSGRPELA